MTTSVALAVDLGGTKTALGIIDPSGVVLHRTKIPTLAQIGGTKLAQHTADEVAKLADYAREQGWEPVGVGVGSAGVIGMDGAVITAANVITDWSGVPLAAIVAKGTGLPTYAINDVHGHALGEAWQGASQNVSTSLMVAFGTGVGGSFIVDGSPLRGAHSLAGHVGHFSSPWAVGIDCPCGGIGHVEAVAAGPGIVRTYFRIGGVSNCNTLIDLKKLAESGDVNAREAIAIGARAAGIALGDLATILDPHLLVVSGGVTNLGDAWWHQLREAYAQATLGQAKETPITIATLGSDAPLLGAARLIPDFTS